MKKIILSICIIALSFWTVLPFFHSGFFPFHDNAQVSRVYEMAKSLDSGMFPVRWVDDFGYGYGYPVFNFYAPLSYYVGATFMFIGNDALAATKIMMVMGILLAGVSMYLLAREFWEDSGGIVSSLLYVYAPYHALDIFVRGDVAEFWAYGILPFIFLCFYKVYKKSLAHIDSGEITNYELRITNKEIKTKERPIGWFIGGGISFALLILSHNLTAMMVAPFVVLLIIILGYKAYIKTQSLQTTYYMLHTFLLGLLLSAFYWVPALLEIPYTNVLSQTSGGFDFHQHFVCFSQFWYSPWGYGGSVPGCTDGLSFMVGKIHIILVIVSVLFAIIFFKRFHNTRVVLFSFVLLLVCLLLTTAVSVPVWNMIHPMAFFQFPWRFLLMVSFFSSFISGFVLYAIKPFIVRRYPVTFYVGFIALLLGIVVLNNKFFQPKAYFDWTNQLFTSRDYISYDLSRDAHEYMPKNFSFPQAFQDIPEKPFTIQGNIPITYLVNKTNVKAAIIHAKKQTMVHANIAYFPVWHISIDNVEEQFQVVSNGINVMVPSGKHTITVAYHQTGIESLADAISLIGIFILIADIILKKRNIFE